MLNSDYVEFISYLLRLTNNNNNDLIGLIIQTILEDIDDGNTCSNINSIAAKLNVSATKILTILQKSNLLEYTKNISTTKFNKLFIALDLDDSCLIYVNRYLSFELIIAKTIKGLINNKLHAINYNRAIHDKLIQLNKQGNPNNEQLEAIKNSINNKFSIITGGPGTGKTSTVMIVLWALYQVYQCKLNVKICAPTGKASKKVQESMQNNKLKDELNNEFLHELINDNANFKTIHRLLGAQFNTNLYQYNSSNRLELDVLIIDESSMLGVALFSRLLNSLDLNKIRHLILLGDKNQLSSVEEGSVFSSLVDALSINVKDLFDNIGNQTINYLHISNRNSSSIGKLANHVLNDNANGVIRSFNQDAQDIKLIECNLNNILEYATIKIKQYYNELDKLISTKQLNIQAALKCYNEHVLLCSNNITQFGTINLNKLLDQTTQLMLQSNSTWYYGKPIIITENNQALDLQNGDIGICFEDHGSIQIYFENGVKLLPVNLPKYNVAYAITIHKSQGSEYEHVSIILPSISTIISRELIYTAITRAKQKVTIFSDYSTLQNAIHNKTNRQSGIKQLLELVE